MKFCKIIKFKVDRIEKKNCSNFSFFFSIGKKKKIIEIRARLFLYDHLSSQKVINAIGQMSASAASGGNFSDDCDIETFEEMQKTINKLHSELRQTRFDLRQKNKQVAEKRLKQEGEFREKIENQSKLIEELKIKIGNVDEVRKEENAKNIKRIEGLTVQIQDLMEERNKLLLENNQQKALILAMQKQMEQYQSQQHLK